MRILVGILVLVAIAHAAPSKEEVDAFAKQMGASLDEVVAMQAKAEAAEKAKDHALAEQQWTGVWQGGAMLRDHAKRAAQGGMFQDPMKFPTKAGTLTAKQYLAKLQALSATGDVRAARASLAAVKQRAEKQKRTAVQTATALTAMLKKQLDAAKRGRDAHAARATLERIEQSAQQLTKAVGTKAPDLGKQLAAIAADAKTARAAIKEPPPAAKTAAKPTARPGAKPTAPTPSGTSSSAPPEAAAPAEPVCETGNINCESSGIPCCAGERCMAAGYIMIGDGYEPDYWACQDPAIAPTPP